MDAAKAKLVLEKEVEALQKIQSDYSKAVANRQQLESQTKENDMVLQELKRMPAESNVYKQVGPVLIKQDKSEAQLNVEKRLEYITGEVKRVEAAITELTNKENEKRLGIIALQQQFQPQEPQEVA